GVAGECEPPVKRQLGRIESNGRHLLTIINEILDISRIEAGRMPLQLSTFRIPDLVSEVKSELEPIIMRTKLAVTLQLPTDLPAPGAEARRPHQRAKPGRQRLDLRADVADQRAEMTTKPDRPRVLLVDDYPDAREMYTEYLEFSGFDVVEAGNGMEALQRAVDAAPDIILMDLSLPVMDGWEATRRLKADERTASIPVVALTGHALAGISEGAKKAGCDAFVT